MKGNLQTPFGKTCLRHPVISATWKTIGLFCLGLLHPYRICNKHCMNSAASHPSSQLPSQKNNARALLLAMSEGQWQTPTQPWPPDHHPSSWGPCYQQEVKADCFSAEDQPVFSQVQRQWQCLRLQCYFEQNLVAPAQDVIKCTQNLLETPFPMWSSVIKILWLCPEQVMNNCKKSLKVQNPLFLISLQEPN